MIILTDCMKCFMLEIPAVKVKSKSVYLTQLSPYHQYTVYFSVPPLLSTAARVCLKQPPLPAPPTHYELLEVCSICSHGWGYTVSNEWSLAGGSGRHRLQVMREQGSIVLVVFRYEMFCATQSTLKSVYMDGFLSAGGVLRFSSSCFKCSLLRVNCTVCPITLKAWVVTRPGRLPT